MRVGICDDDRVWCEKAKKIIEGYAGRAGLDAETVIFASAEEAEQYEGSPMDVMFMDIVLDEEEKSGIEAAAEINRKWKDCQVVYLTNYLYYATEVYHTEHVFFALKEQFERRVDEILGKVLRELSQRREHMIFSVIGGRELSVVPADILCFERSGRKTNIITRNGTFEIWDKLSALTDRLPAPEFVRCHNSYIVYLPAIREMLSDSFIMQDDREIPISRSCRRAARAAFMQWAVTQIS